jgi:hypothetical protein
MAVFCAGVGVTVSWIAPGLSTVACARVAGKLPLAVLLPMTFASCDEELSDLAPPPPPLLFVELSDFDDEQAESVAASATIVATMNGFVSAVFMGGSIAFTRLRSPVGERIAKGSLLRGIRYRSAALVMVAIVCGLCAAPSWATAADVRISAPASLAADRPCRVGVVVSSGVRGTALLQERAGGTWRTVSTARLTRRSVTLRCPTTDRAGRTRRFRALVRRDGRTIARSRTLSVRVTPPPAAVPGAPSPSPPKTPGPPPGAPGPPRTTPLDPGQFGAEGTGGAPSPEALALLTNRNAVLDADGVADLRAGRIDPRVVAVLTTLAAAHKITVSAMCSDHPKFTSGGSISNNYRGRGMDIAAIDGAPVKPANATARKVAVGLGSLDPSYRPDEIGSPWAIPGPSYFTDAAHQAMIHAAFKQPIDPWWTPPA